MKSLFKLHHGGHQWKGVIRSVKDYESLKQEEFDWNLLINRTSTVEIPTELLLRFVELDKEHDRLESLK